jgi:hypothetical protein
MKILSIQKLYTKSKFYEQVIMGISSSSPDGMVTTRLVMTIDAMAIMQGFGLQSLVCEYRVYLMLTLRHERLQEITIRT